MCRNLYSGTLPLMYGGVSRIQGFGSEDDGRLSDVYDRFRIRRIMPWRVIETHRICFCVSILLIPNLSFVRLDLLFPACRVMFLFPTPGAQLLFLPSILSLPSPLNSLAGFETAYFNIRCQVCLAVAFYAYLPNLSALSREFFLCVFEYVSLPRVFVCIYSRK